MSERQAALGYSKTLSSGKAVIEVEEGEEDETFWMFLGEATYAKADYWKWKKQAPPGERNSEPRYWRISCASKGDQVCIKGPLVIYS